MPCSNKKKKGVKQVFLYRSLSVELLVGLIAGLDGILLTLFSLWLGSIAARPTRESNTNTKTLKIGLFYRGQGFFCQ